MPTSIAASTSTTPIGAIARRAAAGLAGTPAVDALWYRRHRRDGGEDGFLRRGVVSATIILAG